MTFIPVNPCLEGVFWVLFGTLSFARIFYSGTLSDNFLVFSVAFFFLRIMSDQSDSQNSLGNNFMTESEPSSPSFNGGPSSSDSSPRDGRTRLLADLFLRPTGIGNLDQNF